MITVIDFGGQLTPLIVKKLRKRAFRAEIRHFTNIDDNVINKSNGFILSGSGMSVLDGAAEQQALCKKIIGLNKPILGICYGYHLMSVALGGTVKKSAIGEFGVQDLVISNIPNNCSMILHDINSSPVLMSHNDSLFTLPGGFINIARTNITENAFICNVSKRLYGVQFHPESDHSVDGDKLLINFVSRICKCPPEWYVKQYLNESVDRINSKVNKSDKIVCAVSGGVDSTVMALLLHKSLPIENLNFVMLDTGLCRTYDIDTTKEIFEKYNLALRVIDISANIFKAIEGISDPEGKRSAISKEYTNALLKAIDGCDYLAQGTIYSDVIESGGSAGSVIKTHHNVSKHLKGVKKIEPIKYLFKDEVRNLGKEIGLDSTYINRHPFPGPGLAIRITGEVTPEKADILRITDEICYKFLNDKGLYNKCWQFFPILLDTKSVGIKGDVRVYSYVCALRAIRSNDGMTANVFECDITILESLANTIINRVDEIGRVVYDITGKPPATIEWE